MRLKHRYIVFQALPLANPKHGGKSTFTSKDLQMALREKIQALYGEVGSGEFGQASYIKYHEPKHSNIFVVKTTREAQTKVHFAVSCISEIAEVPVILHSLRVSSCPRTCQQSLHEIFDRHFQLAEFSNESDREAAMVAVEGVLQNLEL
jgi:RNase P/RNase MRP subunit POP5